MKFLKANLFLAMFMVGITLTSCGGGEAAAVKASPEMTTFMAALSGSSSAVTSALKAHGVEGLETKDMDMYDLKNAKCVAADKDCYTMEAASGMTTRTYVLCWEGGKIKSIEDKGMK